jgi:hypothetical protein
LIILAESRFSRQESRKLSDQTHLGAVYENVESIEELPKEYPIARESRIAKGLPKTSIRYEASETKQGRAEPYMYSLKQECEDLKRPTRDDDRKISMPDGHACLIEDCKSHDFCADCRMSLVVKRLSAENETSSEKNSSHDSVKKSKSKSVRRSSRKISKCESSQISVDQTKRLTNTPVTVDMSMANLKKSCDVCGVSTDGSMYNSESIIQTCQSVGICKDCTSCLARFTLPSPSYVASKCMSHADCFACAHAIRKSMYIKDSSAQDSPVSLERTKSKRSSHKSSAEQRPSYKISRPIVVKSKSQSSESEDERRKSTRSSRRKLSARKASKLINSSNGSKTDSTISKIYEEVKEKIERQNEIIASIQKKISTQGRLNEAEEKLNLLRGQLDGEKEKLRELIQFATFEQRKRKDGKWKPIKISLVDQL